MLPNRGITRATRRYSSSSSRPRVRLRTRLSSTPSSKSLTVPLAGGYAVPSTAKYKLSQVMLIASEPAQNAVASPRKVGI